MICKSFRVEVDLNFYANTTKNSTNQTFFKFRQKSTDKNLYTRITTYALS